MGQIDNILAADAAAFVDVDGIPGAEQLTYTKLGGTTRTVYGNVDRNPPEQILGDGSAYKPKMTIDFPRNTTNGIVPTEINSGGDTITVAYVYGDTAQTYKILSKIPITQDAGMIRLEVG